ncbi:MAG: tRNA uridine-5-carboxymethylaminomethyl(34) synthesis GTPase MnmE [Bdellovibrionota bacterium]
MTIPKSILKMPSTTKNRTTIVAISTPPGIGGVGVIRLSGPDSLSISQALFQTSASFKHSQLCYGYLLNPITHENVDDGFAVYFEAPNSFTGEDVVELQLHGNPFLLSSVVELCLAQGARLASPGEFTKRSYLNGKMDLLQAEAVSELIHSQSVMEARQSRMRLDGKLSSHLEKLRDDVIDVLAEIEADVDFPEEDIDPKSQAKLLSSIQNISATTHSLLSTYNQNQKISSGFRIALVGKPNVGKSSLFNAILQNDRAIVNAQAGTTRDVLSEEIILNGYRVKFFDTAGLRSDTSDEIEKEGITRSSQEIEKADLVLWLGSTLEKHSETELEVLRNVEKSRRWLVWNKVDLEKAPKQFDGFFEKTFKISAKTGLEVASLLENINDLLKSSQNEDFGGGISNDRQKELIEEMIQALNRSMEMIKSKQPPELTAVEFRQIYHALNRILGKEENMEAMYDRIFSKFCVGK